ncbi:MAG: hypothetical protein P8Z68_11320, partial [Kineosporiaceae bacterium]
MSESVQMPALGESVTEGTVTRWLKQVGERIEVDEPLLEVSTDKVDTEIPSPLTGVIEKILVSEDETVPVGADLAVIGTSTPATATTSGAPATTGAPAHAAPAPTRSAPPSPAPAAAPPPSAPAFPGGIPASSSAPTPLTPAAPSASSVPTGRSVPASAPVPATGEEGNRVRMPALGESVTEGTVT